MGLITKEVEVVLTNRIVRHYENLGYKIPREKDISSRLRVPKNTKIIVKVEHLTHGSKENVFVECDSCGKKKENMQWRAYKMQSREDGNYYCLQCAQKIYGGKNKISEEEIKKIVDEKLGEDWKIEEIEIVKGNTGVTLIDPDGYWYDDVKTRFLKKNRFPTRFHVQNKYTKQNINNYLILNNILLELVGEYKTSHEKEKLEFKCLECGSIFKRSWDVIQRGNVLCSCCGDSVSYPEKFGLSLFNQLGINYIHNSKLVKSEKYRYDFIIESKKIVVEMHGRQHYIGGFETYGSGLDIRTLADEQENDKNKKELAESNGYLYIEINCLEAKMEWIKNSILNSELSKIFDLNKVDWLKCHEYSCNSLVKEACNLWNNGIKNTVEIGKIMKLHSSTISRYLKQGVLLDWCDYNAKDVTIYYGNKLGQFSSENNIKPVVQLSLNGDYIKEYPSIVEAEKQTGALVSSISACCRNTGKLKSAGKYQWVFLSDYNKDNIKQYEKSLTVKQVVQLSLDGEYISEFSSIKDAERQLKINHSNISAACLGKYNHAGGYQWIFLSDYTKGERKQYEKRVYGKQVIQLSLDGTYITEFDSVSDVERQLKINIPNISAVCNGRRNNAGGFKWIYKDKWLQLQDNLTAHAI